MKWPGGKRWLARTLATSIGTRVDHIYYEPFLGGGAIYFALNPHQAILSDINAQLIEVFEQVRDNVDEIIEKLKKIPVNKDTYYRMRGELPETSIDRSVRFLYLNRTAFGGIYRLNQEGKFNVPYGGGQRTPELLWKKKILEKASLTLQTAEFKVSDFEPIIEQAVQGDVVYCDPTYTVVHENNNFIRYNERNFSWADQERLAAATKRACERGVLVIVSNASHECLIELYKPYYPIRIERRSLVSRKVAGRRQVSEFLFVLDPHNLFVE